MAGGGGGFAGQPGFGQPGFDYSQLGQGFADQLSNSGYYVPGTGGGQIGLGQQNAQPFFNQWFGGGNQPAPQALPAPLQQQPAPQALPAPLQQQPAAQALPAPLKDQPFYGGGNWAPPPLQTPSGPGVLGQGQPSGPRQNFGRYPGMSPLGRLGFGGGDIGGLGGGPYNQTAYNRFFAAHPNLNRPSFVDWRGQAMHPGFDAWMRQQQQPFYGGSVISPAPLKKPGPY